MALAFVYAEATPRNTNSFCGAISLRGAMSHILDLSTKSLPQQWRCWPARDRPFTGLVACVLIMLLAGAVLLATGDWMWGSLALMGMFLALIGFFLPTDVALSDTKIIVREPLRVRAMQWDSIQACKNGGDALLLIQHGGRRSRQMRLVVPLGRGQFTQVRKHAIEQLCMQCKQVVAMDTVSS